MKTITVTCLLQFDVNCKTSKKNLLKTINFINEALQETNLVSQPQIMVKNESDFLLSMKSKKWKVKTSTGQCT